MIVPNLELGLLEPRWRPKRLTKNKNTTDRLTKNKNTPAGGCVTREKKNNSAGFKGKP